jgi:hypothetical protein
MKRLGKEWRTKENAEECRRKYTWQMDFDANYWLQRKNG